MESTFQWLNDIFKWIGRLFPRWRVVTEAQGGVAFKRGRARLFAPPGGALTRPHFPRVRATTPRSVPKYVIATSRIRRRTSSTL